MDCREAEDQLTQFVLGALGPKDRTSVSNHVESCPECSTRLHSEGDLASELVYAVPPLSAPPRVKRYLFARIEMEASRAESSWAHRLWAGILPGVGRRLVAHAGMAASVALIAVIAFGGVWFNERLNSIKAEREALVAQLAMDVEPKGEIYETVADQRYLVSMVEPGTSVNPLSASKWTVADAHGMLVLPKTGKVALIAASGLPALPDDEVYEVWLIKDGVIYTVGEFIVDPTGYGQAIIDLTGPLSDFDTIVITIERKGDAPLSIGESVLRGDL